SQVLFKVQKSVGGFDRLFGRNVGHNNQFLLHHIFLSKVLPIIDDCTRKKGIFVVFSLTVRGFFCTIQNYGWECTHL
ncbi:MAG: hypothetical protein J6L76_00860, partial [Clostridia bacterium]|nr:hypothetical protein [Clostridia bacterium]